MSEYAGGESAEDAAAARIAVAGIGAHASAPEWP
jgi:hypothetical protein